MKKKLFLILGLALALIIIPLSVSAEGETISVDKDTVISETLTGGDLIITGDHKLTLEGGLEVSGNLTIRGCEVVAKAPGIKATGDITIENAVVNSERTTYGSAILSDGGNVTIKNSCIRANAYDKGDNAIKAAKLVDITDSELVLATSGDNSMCGIDGNDGITMTGGTVDISTKGDGISSYGGSVELNNVRGIINSGGSGVASNKALLTLKDCDLEITGGTEKPDAGLENGGLWCYGAVVIDGGSVKVSSPRGDGVYANDKIELTANTKRFEATGKTYAAKVLVNSRVTGEIVLNGLPIADPEGGTISENGYIVDSNGKAASHVIIGDKSYGTPEDPYFIGMPDSGIFDTSYRIHDDIESTPYPDYFYAVPAGTILSPILTLDGTVLDESCFKASYAECKFYTERNEWDKKAGFTWLDQFPTEPGVYFCKVEGLAPYYGTFEWFDLIRIEKSIAGDKAVLSKTSFTYNGKVQKPTVKTIGGKLLTEGTDYTISAPSSKAAGKYTLKITGKGCYKGTITASYTIVTAANPLKISAKTATIKFKKLKKKNQTLAATAVIKFTKKGQGTTTYTKSSGNKKISINKKTGKVTVKKGLKKGTYKVKVKVKAAGNKNYKAATKTVTFKIKVK